MTRWVLRLLPAALLLCNVATGQPSGDNETAVAPDGATHATHVVDAPPPPAPATPLPSATSLLEAWGLPDPSKQKPKVHPALHRYEEGRAAALAAALDAGVTTLRPLWPRNAQFEMWVWLSTDTAPVSPEAWRGGGSARAAAAHLNVASLPTATPVGAAAVTSSSSLLGGGGAAGRPV